MQKNFTPKTKRLKRIFYVVTVCYTEWSLGVECCSNSNTTGATSGVRTAYSSGAAPEFTPGFY